MKRPKFTRAFKSYPWQKEGGSMAEVQKQMNKRKCGPWFLDAVNRGVFRK